MTRRVMRFTFPSGVFTTSVVSLGWLDDWPLTHRTVRRMTRRMTRLPSALTVVVVFTLCVPSGDPADVVVETASGCAVARRPAVLDGGVDFVDVVVAGALGALRAAARTRAGLCAALGAETCCGGADPAADAATAVAVAASAGGCNARAGVPNVPRAAPLDWAAAWALVTVP